MNYLLKKLFILLTGQFNYSKYWKRRLFLQKKYKSNFFHIIVRLYYFIWCKKVENKFSSSMGTGFYKSALFYGKPILPHGIKGIFINKGATIGKNVTIFHQVTIGSRNGKNPKIEDNCYIGAGAKILGEIKISSGAKIGANAVVINNVRSNSTIVPAKTRVVN